MAEPVTIVGGGLAGLTLGIGLRQRGVPVTVWEAGHYPRQRVCGEFISGAGQASLDRLGLMDGLKTAGGRFAAGAAFFDGEKKVAPHPLPEPALCVSRFVLDEWLALEYQKRGGDLLTGQRWRGAYGTGVVCARGRHPVGVSEGWRWFGLKVHARQVALAADLEMHFLPSGYVGICQLGSGEVNICGLFRSRATVPDLARGWRDWLSGPARSVLRSRLANAQFDSDSFCSVAGLCLRPQTATRHDECRVGDALTMIPPVTGNGMSMAFESAELAIAPLVRYSGGDMSWVEARQEIAAGCERRFRRRLRCAAWLQNVLFRPRARGALIHLAGRSEWLWRQLFARTR